MFNMNFVFHFYILGLTSWIWSNPSTEQLKFESPSKWISYEAFNLEHWQCPKRSHPTNQRNGPGFRIFPRLISTAWLGSLLFVGIGRHSGLLWLWLLSVSLGVGGRKLLLHESPSSMSSPDLLFQCKTNHKHPWVIRLFIINESIAIH